MPTQYVAEVVRAAGYDGVAFESSLGPGTNIVLFDRNDAKVSGVELYHVRHVNYDFGQHPDSLPPSARD